jgi:hypothetical protein
MTVNECLAKVKDRKPNAYSDESLTDRLNEIEARVQREILLKDPDDIIQYSFPDDRDKELILPKPYDSAYVYYIKMMVEFDQEEYSAYNNTMAMFTMQYQDAEKYYNKLNPNPPAIRIKNWMRG